MSGPRKKLVERFEVIGVRLGGELHEAGTESHYEADVNGTVVRILKLNYETHLDARLGASGLRGIDYTILGITDLHTDKRVDDAPLQRGELAWKMLNP